MTAVHRAQLLLVSVCVPIVNAPFWDKNKILCICMGLFVNAAKLLGAI